MERARLEALDRPSGSGVFRARLQLEASGEIKISAESFEGGRAAELDSLGKVGEGAPLRLHGAPTPVDSGQRWLCRKTTRRQAYDAARAACAGADDVPLWNEPGEITETTIGNVVARLVGRLVAPPVSCGLLPGTLCGWLLEHSGLTSNWSGSTWPAIASCIRLTRWAGGSGQP